MIISLLALSALSLVSYLLWLGTHNLHVSGSHPHPTGPHGSDSLEGLVEV